MYIHVQLGEMLLVALEYMHAHVHVATCSVSHMDNVLEKTTVEGTEKVAVSKEASVKTCNNSSSKACNHSFLKACMDLSSSTLLHKIQVHACMHVYLHDLGQQTTLNVAKKGCTTLVANYCSLTIFHNRSLTLKFFLLVFHTNGWCMKISRNTLRTLYMYAHVHVCTCT